MSLSNFNILIETWQIYCKDNDGVWFELFGVI